MKKNSMTNLLSIVTIALALLTSGCTKKDFGDVNIDPYNTTTPNTRLLLTGALKALPATTNNTDGVMYAQYLSNVQYTDGSRFVAFQFSYASLYVGTTGTNPQAGPLINLQRIIEANTNPELAAAAQGNGSTANQIAVARILKAYYFFHITNRWGDIPYFQALKPDSSYVPKFDRQEDVYVDLFKELKEASAQFDNGALVTGDIFLSGSVARWKMFANSLRLIMALRLSKANPVLGKAEFLQAKAAGVAMTNAESFPYAHLADANNQNEWYARYITRYDYAISTSFLAYLKNVNDPRIPAMIDKPANGSDYNGMPFGLAVTSGIPATTVSPVALSLRRQNTPEIIIRASHILFTLAEGEKLGWNTAGVPNDAQAASYYNEAIKISMEQFGVYTTSAYANYIAQPLVSYTPGEAIKKISEQRWVALYLNGYEAWMEWRRTGYPVLSPGPAPMSVSGQIPRRQAYTPDENNLNKTNYDAVVADQGPDRVDTRMYIDPL